MFQPYTLQHERILKRVDHGSCDSSFIKEVVCVDRSGEYVMPMASGEYVYLVTKVISIPRILNNSLLSQWPMTYSLSHDCIITSSLLYFIGIQVSIELFSAYLS